MNQLSYHPSSVQEHLHLRGLSCKAIQLCWLISALLLGLPEIQQTTTSVLCNLINVCNFWQTNLLQNRLNFLLIIHVLSDNHFLLAAYWALHVRHTSAILKQYCNWSKIPTNFLGCNWLQAQNYYETQRTLLHCIILGTACTNLKFNLLNVRFLAN